MAASLLLSVPEGVAKSTFIISPQTLHNRHLAQIGFLAGPPPVDKVPMGDVIDLLVYVATPSHSGRASQWTDGWRCSGFHGQISHANGAIPRTHHSAQGMDGMVVGSALGSHMPT